MSFSELVEGKLTIQPTLLGGPPILTHTHIGETPNLWEMVMAVAVWNP